jgi:hypothetical protein
VNFMRKLRALIAPDSGRLCRDCAARDALLAAMNSTGFLGLLFMPWPVQRGSWDSRCRDWQER